MVKADGSESKQVTNSKVNAGFPAWHPDGKTIIYRVWGTAESPDTRGLRALNLADNSVTTLTTDWDNFPFIAPTGDRVVFTRRMPDFDFEVFTMNVDGSDVKRLTSTAGADAHATWTADGREIWFESSRTGFKDEAAMFDACSAHWAEQNPVPNLAAWESVADPDERLERALEELYGFYDRNEQMLANGYRDAPLMPVVAGMCLGSIMNPGAFLALAVRPSLGKETTGPFTLAVGSSFVLTTMGYGGAAWSIARAALAA